MTAPPRHNIADLAARIKAGDRVALARGISLVESGDPEGLALSEAVFTDAGRAHIVGITGPPGAGKSTLADALVRTYRARDLTVAVLAVDPVSPRTGGATLGDRIRMTAASADRGVFIRSSAARGQHGGLGLTTMQAARLMDVAGYDRIIIETVGTGQDGVTISTVAATIVLVQTPNSGDDVQALKAGILELADVYVVNKAELPGAEAMIEDLREVAEAANQADQWSRPVVATTAADGNGVPALVEAIEAHRAYLQASPDGEQRQAVRLWAEVQALVHNEVRVAVDRYLTAPATMHAAVPALIAGRTNPLKMARSLLTARGWMPTPRDTP
ncbi:MAG: methylmalonyl Co-A mutase-associated GTPase MeaB [Chloroflexota bacterium]|nr:methylmalonyl Co-A mutase-associated GTPase MeaB [Chloroflexota bacterium]MDQ6905983.1 methylmalonyl Co-A mutase-associated GTPase MeaB [Chloroflexota bacterium]